MKCGLPIHIKKNLLKSSDVDPHHFDAESDADLDSTDHPGADPDSYFYLMRILFTLM